MINKIDIIRECIEMLEDKRNKCFRRWTMNFEKSQWYAKAINDLEDYLISQETMYDLLLLDQEKNG